VYIFAENQQQTKIFTKETNNTNHGLKRLCAEQQKFHHHADQSGAWQSL